MKEIPNSLVPVLATRNLLLFPDRASPISVRRSRTVAAVETALEQDGYIIVVAQNQMEENAAEPTPQDLHRIGTLAKIERVRGTHEQGYQILVRGLSRVRLLEPQLLGNTLVARVENVVDKPEEDAKTLEALNQAIRTLATEILGMIPGDTSQVSKLVNETKDLAQLVNLSLENLDVPIQKKQELYENDSLKSRALLLLEVMHNFRESLQIQVKINQKLSERMGKMQRDAILREQMQAIREELGDTPAGKSEDEYEKRIQDSDMPEDVKKVALEEAKRLQSIGPNSPETHVIRNYLDLLCTLPWASIPSEDIDLERARASLNADHFGLEKIKSRLVQHLAVSKLKKNVQGSILLFVGPPGVGKTSLGQSVAKALGRKFVRASLGGVRDEAEIRGHRRTYIGAMPGRIVQAIKRAGVNNPVFLLDEIDKMGSGYGGDPSGALLEVLDPEQNNSFLDHYLDVPYDLSNVFFIATANSLETIPAALLDRMEIIEVAGYTTAEKLHIALQHLVPKQLEAHGLTTDQLLVAEDAVSKIITGYTREAGVRDLQRKISALCRAATEKVLALNVELPVKLGTDDLEDLLGQERFSHEVVERMAPPGVVTGLAWTPLGGEILFIEASHMPGSGRLILTGQLGDVMKESAQIALSLVRAKLAPLLPLFEHEKRDLHIHVPAGAIPKDGPSAGVTMLTTIASLLSGRSVNTKLAMTGEITLRGAVTPVGGIKEKVLAAHRAGIDKVLLSRKNQKDLKEIPEEVKATMSFEFVDTVDDVLRIALALEPAPFTLLGAENILGVKSVLPPAI
jgi:ATP-dependent Lon protease